MNNNDLKAIYKKTLTQSNDSFRKFSMGYNETIKFAYGINWDDQAGKRIKLEKLVPGQILTKSILYQNDDIQNNGESSLNYFNHFESVDNKINNKMAKGIVLHDEIIKYDKRYIDVGKSMEQLHSVIDSEVDMLLSQLDNADNVGVIFHAGHPAKIQSDPHHYRKEQNLLVTEKDSEIAKSNTSLDSEVHSESPKNWMSRYFPELY